MWLVMFVMPDARELLLGMGLWGRAVRGRHCCCIDRAATLHMGGGSKRDGAPPPRADTLAVTCPPACRYARRF